MYPARDRHPGSTPGLHSSARPLAWSGTGLQGRQGWVQGHLRPCHRHLSLPLPKPPEGTVKRPREEPWQGSRGAALQSISTGTRCSPALNTPAADGHRRPSGCRHHHREFAQIKQLLTECFRVPGGAWLKQPDPTVPPGVSIHGETRTPNERMRRPF